MTSHNHTTKAPHFFKIILDDTIRDRKLRIPRKFVRDYGDGLSNQALLKVPGGELWKVELTKCDGEVWLQKGWQEFAEYYSLYHGHFLVFRYEGNCHFHILIFDKSTSEIEYPYSSTHGKELNIDREFQEHNVEETENDVSVDDITPRKKARGKSPLPCPRPHKMMRTNTTNNNMSSSKSHSSVPHIRANDIQSTGMNHENSKRDINSLSTTQKFRGLNFAANSGGGRAPGRMSTNEKSKAFQRASAFKSENPFFMVVMQPSYVRNRSRVWIPKNFARKYLTKNYGDVVLCISDGRTWSAKYSCEVYSGNPRATFLNGWSQFAVDNNLEVGDVCVFELINESTKISLKVLIFRVVDDENCRQSLADGAGGANRTDYEARSPHDQCLTKEFLVPKVEENEKEDYVENLNDFSPCQKIKKESPSGLCQKKMRTNKGSKTKSTTKLQKLSPSHRHEGIQSNGVKFKKPKRNISLHSKAKEGCGGMSTAQRCSIPKVAQGMRSLTSNEKARALQRASAFESANPFFVVAMQPSYVCRGCNLNLPWRFFKRYFKENHGEVVLQVSDGRTWTVNYGFNVSNLYKKATFNSRWQPFAWENKLKVGDVCVFELIKSKHNLLKVVIFPAEKDANCSLLLADERGAIQVKPKKNLVTKIEPDFTNGDEAGISSPCNRSLPQRKCKIEPSEFNQLTHEQSSDRQDTWSPFSSASRALEAASNFITKNPFFKVSVRSCHLKNGIVNVPLCFMKNFSEQRIQSVMLQVADRSWLVKLISYPSSGMLSSGWYAFARENALQLGDVCVFELIEGSEAVLKVSIFRCVG